MEYLPNLECTTFNTLYIIIIWDPTTVYILNVINLYTTYRSTDISLGSAYGITIIISSEGGASIIWAIITCYSFRVWLTYSLPEQVTTHFFAHYREQWFLGCSLVPMEFGVSLVCLIINHPLLVVVQLSNFTTKNYWQAPIIISLGSQFSFPFVAEHITMVQSHHPYGLCT